MIKRVQTAGENQCKYELLDGNFCGLDIEKREEYRDKVGRKVCIYHSHRDTKKEEFYSKIKKYIEEKNKEFDNDFKSLNNNLTSEEREERIDELREKHKIDFEGFYFPPDADFKETEFKTNVEMSKTVFSGEARFTGVEFGSAAVFINTKFEKDVYFRVKKFGGKADFSGAEFCGEADFFGAEFGGVADFRKAKFEKDADFRVKKFSGVVSYAEAEFSGVADFSEAKFEKDADFRVKKFSGMADFEKAEFGGMADFRYVKFEKDADFRVKKFGGVVNYGDTEFSGVADFSNAKFKKDAYFRVKKFSGMADFESSEFDGVADFCSVNFEKDTDFRVKKFRGETHFWNTEFGGEIDFSGVIFEKYADFRVKKFGGKVKFSNTEFEERADFSNAKFEKDADFSVKKFSGVVDYTKTEFNGVADFSNAKFEKAAYFSVKKFVGLADFSYAEFGESVVFNRAEFGGITNFSYAIFKNAHFIMTKFSGLANFYWAEFRGEAHFWKANYAGEADFSSTIFWGKTSFRDTSFKEKTNFKSAAFLSESVDFSDTAFPEDKTFFHRAIFNCEAHFHRTVLKGVRFTNCYIGSCSFLGSDVRDAVFINATWDRSFLEKQIEDFKKEREPDFPVEPFKLPTLSRLALRKSVLFDEIEYIRGKKKSRLEEMILSVPRSFKYLFKGTPDNEESGALTKQRRPKRPIKETSENGKAEDEKEKSELNTFYLESLYCQFKLNMDQNKSFVQANDFYFGEKLMERKNLWREGKKKWWNPFLWLKWLFLWFYWFLSGYGNRPIRAVLNFVGIIALASLLLVCTNAVQPVNRNPDSYKYQNLITSANTGDKERPLKNQYSVIPAEEPESDKMFLFNEMPDQVRHDKGKKDSFFKAFKDANISPEVSAITLLKCFFNLLRLPAPCIPQSIEWNAFTGELKIIRAKKEASTDLKKDFCDSLYYVIMWNITATPALQSGDYKARDSRFAHLCIFLIQWIYRPLMITLIIISVRRKIKRG